jgi:hypothetical protein
MRYEDDTFEVMCYVSVVSVQMNHEQFNLENNK